MTDGVVQAAILAYRAEYRDWRAGRGPRPLPSVICYRIASAAGVDFGMLLDAFEREAVRQGLPVEGLRG